MNCFEVRNDFVAFWRQTLANDRRTQMLHHFQQCANCDGSFRSFALTAPVLYSASEPECDSAVVAATSLTMSAFDEQARSRTEHQRRIGGLSRALPAFLMAAAAAVALYFAVPGPVTFEDAIAAENPNTEIAVYPSSDSLFGQEIIAQNSVSPNAADE